VMDHHSVTKNKSENTSNNDNINLKSSPKIHPSNALIEGIFNKIKVSEVSGCATKPLIDETTDLRTRSNKGEFHDNKISNTEYKPTKIESSSYQNNESSGLLSFGTGEGSSKVKVNHKVPHNDSRLPQNIDESLDILQRLKSRKSFEKIQNTLFSNPSNQSKSKSPNRPLQQQKSTLHPFCSNSPDNVNGPANSIQEQRPLKKRRGLTLAEQEEERERKNAKKNYYRNQKIIERQREEEKRRSDKLIPCSFYQKLGRCNNGDACRFSHDIEIIKTDVCKFYLTGACLKGKNCIYYHGEWPCKFFHLKGFCKEGDNCKFSHQPMTDQMKKLFDDRTEFEKSQKQMVEFDSNIKSFNDQPEEVSFTTITTAITSPAAITTPDAENEQPSTESTAPVVNPIDLLPSLYSDLS